MKLFWWAADEGGCAFYRMHTPSAALSKLNHTSEVSLMVVPSWVRDATVVGQRVSKDGPSQMWAELAKRNNRLVYDVDDDYFNIDAEFEESFTFYNRTDTQAHIMENIQIADVVTACSDVLAEQMSAYNSNVVMIPNGLPAEVLNWQRPQHEHITLGYACTKGSMPGLRMAAPQIARFLDRTKANVVLHTVGVPGEVLKPILKTDFMATDFVTGTLEYLKYIDFDVWLAPYHRSPYTHAKGATKALEAAFLGIPIIASDIRPYRDFVRHGETGFIVKQEHEWGKYMRLLVEDEDARREMGERARVQATQFVAESLAPQWERVLGGGR